MTHIIQGGPRVGRYPESRIVLDFGKKEYARGRKPVRMKVISLDRGISYPSVEMIVEFEDTSEALEYLQRFVRGQGLPFPRGERQTVLEEDP